MVAGLIYYATGFGNSSTKHQPQTSVTGFGNSSTKHQPQTSVTGSGSTSTQDQRFRYGEMTLGIAYGTTAKQLLREIGSPTKKQADCWLYRGQVGRIRGRYSGPYVDAMKFCFSAGPTGGNVMTQIFSHYAGHTIAKEHFPAQWAHPVTLLKVPDWYLQEKS